MSSGDSTSRACCGVRSIQRTWSGGAVGAEAPRPARASVARALFELGRNRARSRRPRASACGGGQRRRAERVRALPQRRRPRSSQRSLTLPRTSRSAPARPAAARAPRCSMPACRSCQAPARARAPARRPAGRAPRSISLRRAQRRAEELHAGFDQLVRLVEDRGVDGRQQFGDAAVAQRHVGEEQVVVDDHQVGRHRFAPRLHHVAGAVLGALAAQAVLACRGHQRDHRRAVVQPFDLGQVAAACATAPSARRGAARARAKRSGSCAPTCACVSRCRHR